MTRLLSDLETIRASLAMYPNPATLRSRRIVPLWEAGLQSWPPVTLPPDYHSTSLGSKGGINDYWQTGSPAESLAVNAPVTYCRPSRLSALFTLAVR